MTKPRTGTIAVVHDRSEAVAPLSSLLSRQGFRVVSTTSIGEATNIFQHFPPDAILVSPALAEAERAALALLTRNSEGGAPPPVVAVLAPGGDDRLRALRLGLNHQLSLPSSAEEVELVLGGLLGGMPEVNQALAGRLEILPVVQLITMLSASRKDARVALESNGRSASLTVRRGEVVDAADDQGGRGEAAINELLSWNTGSFTVDFDDGPEETLTPKPATPANKAALAPPSPPPNAPAPTVAEPSGPSALTSVALPDDTTPASDATDTVRRLVVHRSLTLLNIVSSFASAFVQQPMLSRKIEAVRATLAERRPVLAAFTVSGEGGISLDPNLETLVAEVSPRLLVDLTAEWVLAVVFELQRTFPGSLPKATLRILAESAGADMGRLGFLRALGLE